MTVDDSEQFGLRASMFTPDDVPEGRLPIITVAAVVAGGERRRQAYVVEQSADIGAALDHFITDNLADHDGYVAADIAVKLVEEPWQQIHVSPGPEGPDLVFGDGSMLPLRSLPNSHQVDPIRDDPERVDVGLALLEPITEREYGYVEAVLQVLWEGAANQSLTAGQEQQILAIARLIEAQHRDTQPGQTERWKMIGPIRAGLRYLRADLPKEALAWWKLSELLADAGWPDVFPF